MQACRREGFFTNILQKCGGTAGKTIDIIAPGMILYAMLDISLCWLIPAKQRYFVMDSLRSVPHAAGTRQTERAVEAGTAAYVLLAQDAEERVKSRISALCAVYGVEVKRADSMKELGRLCGIAVGCAACAVLNNFR